MKQNLAASAYEYCHNHSLHRRAFFCAGAALAVSLTACDLAKTQFHSIDISGADYAKDFSMDGAVLDQYGKPQSLANFAGKVVVVFFGYTQCPDVCPTTMAELSQAKTLLGARGKDVQGIFITVDPQRDTPEILKPYAAAFDPELLALRTTPDKLALLATAYKVYFSKVPGKSPESYTMDHSAGSYIYDPKGRVRLYSRYGLGAKPLAEDIAKLFS